jgi:inosine-uridine nucleoside N-ribohydrolase
MTTRLVLDVDTGTDDAIAIMLAALHPDLDLIAVCSVSGNVDIDHTTENSLRVLDHIGRSDIPVYRGAERPIARPDQPVSRAYRKSLFPGGISPVHGEFLPIPEATSKEQEKRAPIALLDIFADPANSDVVLVAVGPLTNLAMALQLDASFAQNVKKLVIMGGAHEWPNVTPSAEYNFWADPEAAKLVVNSGIEEIVIVPLDATHRALVNVGDTKALRDSGTPAGLAAADIIEKRIQGYKTAQPMPEDGAAPVHDALCVAYLLDETVVSGGTYYVDVETEGPTTVGRSVVDVHNRIHEGRDDGPARNAFFAFDADAPKFRKILVEALTRS